MVTLKEKYFSDMGISDKELEPDTDPIEHPIFPVYNEMVECPHCPGAFANEVIKFVGFRGRMETHEHPKGGEVQLAVLDIQGEVYPGEARPEPIVPVSKKRNLDNLIRLTGKTEQEIGKKYYIGILEYEVATIALIFLLGEMGYEDVMVLKPRGHGKTYENAWTCQIDMKWFHQNQMMLSETSARLKVGNWIYLWALHNGYLKNPEKFARKSTYQHFELLDGIRMDIYKYSEENLVGEHDYKLKLDDTIKKKWQHRPTENEKMNEHWDSNVNYIIRTGLVDFGTRKYEGDPLQHRMESIEDMVVIKMSPFIRCEHDTMNPQNTFNPCTICQDKALLAPEIHSYDELMDKMESNYESWYSEMMQDPHPRAGGMVEEKDICYVEYVPREEVKACGIGVDVAEVWEDTMLADMSSVVSCIMSGEYDEKKKEHRKFTFTTAVVRRMPFRNTKNNKGRMIEGIIEAIDKQVKYFQDYYPEKRIYIAIERNGPGIVLIDQILREKWPWMKYIIADKGQAVKWTREGKANVKLGINHPTTKVPRVFGELRHSIKQEQTRFTTNLENTTFMTQLLSFPKGKHDDGPDSGGMIKDELNRRWKQPRNVIPRETIQEKRVRERAEKAFKRMGQPWLEGQERALRRQKMQQAQNRRIFK